MTLTALTKVLNKRDIDRIPSDILKKLKKHYINNEEFIELKELYNKTKSNMDTLRNDNDHLKVKYKTAETNQKQLQQQLDTALAEISRLCDENRRITKGIQSSNQDSNSDEVTFDNLPQNYEQLQQQLDTANTEIVRLIDENGRIANEIKSFNQGFSKDGGTLDKTRESHEKPNASVEDFQSVNPIIVQIDPHMDLMLKNWYGDTVNRTQIDTLEKQLHTAVAERDSAVNRLAEMILVIEGLRNDILNLKSELNTANEMLKTDKNDTEKILEKIYPGAAAANRLLKHDLSLTDIFNQYYSSIDDVERFKEECLQLNTKLEELASKHQEKISEFENQKIEHDKLLKSVEDLNQKVIDSTLIQDFLDETTSRMVIVQRENAQLKYNQKEISLQLRNILGKIETDPVQAILNPEQFNSLCMTTESLQTSSIITASVTPQHEMNSSGNASRSEAIASPQNQPVEPVNLNQATKEHSRKRPHDNEDNISSHVEDSSVVTYSADEDARKCSMMMLSRAKLVQQKKQNIPQQDNMPILARTSVESKNQQKGNNSTDLMSGNSNVNNASNDQANKNLRLRSKTTYYNKRLRLTDNNVSSYKRSNSADRIQKHTAHKNDQQLYLDRNKGTNQTNLHNASAGANHLYVAGSQNNCNRYGRQHTYKNGNYTDTRCCVRVTNMNTSTLYHAIRYFFYGLEIPRYGIILLCDANGMRKNEAMIRFESALFANYALNWDGKLLDGYFVNVSSTTDREYDNEVNLLRRFARINSAGNQYGKRKADNQGEFPKFSRESNRNNNILITDSSNGEDSIQRNHEVCVVSLNNVPVEATPQDVQHFFGEYNLRRSDIYQKCNADGSLPPYVRVRFSTPMDALQAIQHHQGERIRNNAIYLSLVT